MTLSGRNQKIFHWLIFLLYLVFFTSVIFSLRALSSISIALILLAGMCLNKWTTGKIFNKKIFNPFAITCFLFYLIQFVSLTYTHSAEQQWSGIRIKSSLLFIPLAMSCCDFLNSKNRRSLLAGYCLLLFSASLYCLVAGLIDYRIHQNAEVFFYHDLVKPIYQHAIQFSILVLIALFFLFESLMQDRNVFSRYIHLLLMIFFSIFLFLLSSKLLIILYSVYLIYFFATVFLSKNKSRSLAIFLMVIFFSGAALVFFTKNPISNRFKEVVNGDINFIRQKNFKPGDYFTGLQFRLLQWRLVSEILTENKAWLQGVSEGDAQQKLDQKYISENMYTGEEYRHDRGYLGYNTHNQLLESLLQNGIIGAVLFLLICFSLIKMAWVKKNRLLSLVVVMLLLYCFSESVFETQYSLLIFTFFPLFLLDEN